MNEQANALLRSIVEAAIKLQSVDIDAADEEKIRNLDYQMWEMLDYYETEPEEIENE